MKILVILSHPDKNSFNHAIAHTTVETLKTNKHEVFFHDLCEENFNPILPAHEFLKDAELPDEIEKYCSEISQADGIVIIHPNWWGQPPAILKGWVDRVIRPGVAYEFVENDKGEGVPKGLLVAKSAIVFNTSNTESTREINVFGDPLESIWKNCIFDLCGVKEFYRRMFNIIVISSREKREAWLSEVKDTVNKFYPMGQQQAHDSRQGSSTY
ncbi:MAG: NAD(P)H-dependent oxidoreductase [Desulforhopalus sp.]